GILYGHNRGESYSTIARNIKCRKTTVHDILKHTEAGTTISLAYSAEEFDESCLVPTVGRSPGHMFWGCFSWHRLGPIILIHGHITGEVYTQLMRKYGISTIHQLVPNGKGIFQQDNAPSHKSRKAIDFFDNAGISILSWPPQSPDLNPLENFWQE
ncbi:30270_t:CDS:2, partial [Racocetra persica]